MRLPPYSGGLAVRGGCKRTQASHLRPTPPQFTADGKLTRPADYRRWIYLSSGFGMSYNPNAGGNGAPAFTNVFVNPRGVRLFSGQRKVAGQDHVCAGGLRLTLQRLHQQDGSFQSAFMGLDVEVKDEARFPDKWAYFNFDGDETTASRHHASQK